MASRRECIRVTCESLCFLNHNDDSYKAILENFSKGGALVKVGNLLTNELVVGAKVYLTIYSRNLNPVKHSPGKVVWINSYDVGIQF
jgi:hypothetical protein